MELLQSLHQLKEQKMGLINFQSDWSMEWGRRTLISLRKGIKRRRKIEYDHNLYTYYKLFNILIHVTQK